MSHKQALWATLIVLAHLAVGLVHDAAHKELVVELTPFQFSFVQIFYLILPVVAAILVWTPLMRLGAGLVAVSLGASLVFGIWFHFLFVSPDHVAHLPVGDSQWTFQVTAVLMALVDAAGAWLGVRFLRSTETTGS